MAQTALITGASGGIGREYARIFAGEGFDTVLVDRDEKNLLALQKELQDSTAARAWAFVKDLSEKDAALDVYQFTKENDITVDVLVNNVGFGDFSPFSKADWQKQYDMVMVNLVAMMQLTHCYLNPMTRRGYGRILNMSSVAAFCAGPDMCIYYASKAFILSFSQAVDYEMKGTGVTVTALCPGPTSTGFEKAANMNGSRMFSAVKTAKPHDVAMAGYKAAMKSRSVRLYGGFTNVMNVLSRLVPRKWANWFAHYINN